MNEPFRETHSNFSRGIVDNIPPDQIPDDAVSAALNMEFDKRQHLRTRNGCAVLNKNHNLDASVAFSVISASYSGTTTANDQTAPDGTVTGDSFQGAIQRTGPSFTASSSDWITASIYFRVPTVPTGVVDVPMFVASSGSHGSQFTQIILEPTPDGWKVSPDYGIGLVVTGAIGIGEIVADPSDNSWSWVQVYTSQLSDGATGAMTVDIESHRAVFTENQDGTFSRVGTSPGPTVEIGIWGYSTTRTKFIVGRPLSTWTTPATVASNYLADRVTSLYQYRSSSASDDITLATSGDGIYEYNEAQGWFESIHGLLNLKSDTQWQWVTFDGKCIGVNRGDGTASEVNPVLIDTPSTAPAALTGTPPAGRYIAVFNKRVWIVSEAEPWKVKFCKLGDAEDWTDTGISSGAGSLDIGGAEENFDITGMHVHQGVLLVFKRDSIHAIVPGSPNTDVRQYTVQTFSNEIGCLAQESIKTILQDVVFLSRDGLTTLSIISSQGNYEASLLTQHIQDFNDFERVEESAVTGVYPRKSQYIISLRTPGNSVNNRTYIMDYSDFQSGNIGFTQADGALLAECMGNALIDAKDRLLLGSKAEDGIARVYLYDDEDAEFLDAGQPFDQQLTTKAYAPSDEFVTKRGGEFGFYLQLLDDDVDLAVNWNTNLLVASKASYLFNRTGQTTVGAKWGSAIFGTSVFASGVVADLVHIRSKFSPSDTFNSSARSFQATLSASPGQGYVLRGLLLTGSVLHDKEWGQ